MDPRHAPSATRSDRRPRPRAGVVHGRASPVRRIPLAALVLAAVGLAACGGRPMMATLPDERSCRTTVVVGPAADTLAESADTLDPALRDRWAVEWRLPEDPDERARLNPWCAAVGPAVVADWTGAGEPEGTALDTLWVVAWNVHIGGGDLRAFVGDLRSGELTGTPVRHFVLLLQEVYRSGPLVPERDPGLPGGGETRPVPASGEREDIQSLAESLGLALIYAPAMRNGPGEDRGNAILSTVPFVDPLAVPLPVARQRRVSLAARAEGRTVAGEPWELQVASVHLENQTAWWRNPEEERLGQAETLLEALPTAAAAVAGGDFNTKTRGREEALVFELLRAYPDTPDFPPGPTYRKVYGIYRGYLDYLFFRLPDGADASYDRVRDAYGSDHYPLVGRIVW